MLFLPACSTQENDATINNKNYDYKMCGTYFEQEIIEVFDLHNKDSINVDYIKMISNKKGYEVSINREYPMIIFDKGCLKLQDGDHDIELQIITERGEGYSLRYGVYAKKTGEITGIEIRHSRISV